MLKFFGKLYFFNANSATERFCLIVSNGYYLPELIIKHLEKEDYSLYSNIYSNEDIFELIETLKNGAEAIEIERLYNKLCCEVDDTRGCSVSGVSIEFLKQEISECYIMPNYITLSLKNKIKTSFHSK